MRPSDFVVRKFRSAALERAFHRDYARRYAGQRRIASAIFTLIWVYFVIRDLSRPDALDPADLYHHQLVYLRLVTAVVMSAAVGLLWGRRAYDERWAVALLS